jgi:hypothetical protein
MTGSDSSDNDYDSSESSSDSPLSRRKISDYSSFKGHNQEGPVADRMKNMLELRNSLGMTGSMVRTVLYILLVVYSAFWCKYVFLMLKSWLYSIGLVGSRLFNIRA